MYYGMSVDTFWDSTIHYVRKYIKVAKERELNEQRNKAYMDYVNCNLVGLYMGIVMGSKQKIPQLHELYPNLFDSPNNSKQSVKEEYIEIDMSIEEYNRKAKEMIAKYEMEKKYNKLKGGTD